MQFLNHTYSILVLFGHRILIPLKDFIFYKRNLYGSCTFWIVMHIQPLFLRIQTYSNFLIKLLLKTVFLLRINSTKPYQYLLKICSLSLQIHIYITQDGLILVVWKFLLTKVKYMEDNVLTIVQSILGIIYKIISEILCFISFL